MSITGLILLLGSATGALAMMPGDDRELSDTPAMPALDWSRPPLAENLKGPPARNPWLDVQRGEWEPLTHQGQTSGLFGTVTSQVILRDPNALRAQPVIGDQWRADETWKLDVTGPVYVFGQMGAGGDLVIAQEARLNGRTGLAWKLPTLLPVAEVELRGGQALSVTDPLRQVAVKNHPELFMEVQARCPLIWKLGLEYQGTAIPNLTPLGHDRIQQDVRLAVPLGDAGKFRLGAKHQLELTDQPHSWTDGTQLYLGVELKR